MNTNNALKHKEILGKIPAPLLHWYHTQRRTLPWRENPAPYRVWLSEVMLQQTRVAAVMPYFERFLAALPNISDLAQCSEDSLMKLWQGLGYYNRARNLQKTAQIVMTDYNGRLPENFDELLKLPGIGRYTAAAISSIAYGHCHPAVDGNVLRVITRVLACPEDILKDRTKRMIEDALLEVYPKNEAGDLNQAFMELGATICLPNGAPLCMACPLRGRCLACQHGTIEKYPYKQPKKKRRIEKLTILRIEYQGTIAIQKREESGLLAGLWELPHLSGHLAKDDIISWLQSQNLRSVSVEALPSAKHIFTHIEWNMIGWRITLKTDCIAEAPALYGKDTPSREFKWANKNALQNIYSIPSAFQYFLER